MQLALAVQTREDLAVVARRVMRSGRDISGQRARWSPVIRLTARLGGGFGKLDARVSSPPRLLAVCTRLPLGFTPAILNSGLFDGCVRIA